jgi:hypothetical protein
MRINNIREENSDRIKDPLASPKAFQKVERIVSILRYTNAEDPASPPYLSRQRCDLRGIYAEGINQWLFTYATYV